MYNIDESDESLFHALIKLLAVMVVIIILMFMALRNEIRPAQIKEATGAETVAQIPCSRFWDCVEYDEYLLTYPNGDQTIVRCAGIIKVTCK